MMKKLISVITVLCLLLSLAACGAGDTKTDTADADTAANTAALPTETKTASKSLVVYFSRSGNTKRVAESVQRQTGSDIFEIVPVNPYDADYSTVTALAKEEKQSGARPEIADKIDNIADYDVICVGYPIWWGDMPMILYTFFESYDLSGKTVAPFCTSGGSGLSGTVNTIKQLQPNAVVTSGLHIDSADSADPDGNVRDWLGNIGLNK